MKRVFVMLLMLGSLVATVGFANAFTLNVGGNEGQADIATGEDRVNACTADAVADLVPGDYDASEGDFTLQSVDITTNSAECADYDVVVQLTQGSGDGSALGDPESGTLDGSGNGSIDFSGQAQTIDLIEDLHIVLDEPAP